MKQHTRVAVFGTSRSGKDYTIKGALKLLGDVPPIRHVSPIHMVHDELHGASLKTMSQKDKQKLVDKVRDDIDDICLEVDAVVDEHYCFPVTYGGEVVSNGYTDEKLPYDLVYDAAADRDFEVVFEDFEIRCYDAAVYMDVDPVVILGGSTVPVTRRRTTRHVSTTWRRGRTSRGTP